MSSPLTSPTRVLALLKRYGLRPRKPLGQNFLIDANILRRIVETASLTQEEGVLEIGAGIGTLTHALSQVAHRVVAVEIDSDLQPILRETLADCGNVEVIQEDFLKLDLFSLLRTFFGDRLVKVVSNLPYCITTPVLERLLACRQRFQSWTLLMQKEVALRLIARPGTREYGSLTLFVRYTTRPVIAMTVSPNVFLPAPGVDSALVQFEILPEPAVRVIDESLFFTVVQAIFRMRRKTLLNALSGSPRIGLSRDRTQDVLSQAGFSPSVRGETLSLEEMGRLSDAIALFKIAMD